MEVSLGQGSDQLGSSTPAQPLVIFNCCKKESHTLRQGFKNLGRRLKTSYRTLSNKVEISIEVLKEAAAVVFGSPQEKFTKNEVDSLHAYVKRGGCLLYLSTQGGHGNQGSNVNDIIQQYGITINSDCLVRTVQEKYLHPKEVLVTDSSLSKELKQFASKGSKRVEEAPRSTLDTRRSRFPDIDLKGEAFGKVGGTGLQIVYPYGATLTVKKPAAAILSSGMIAFPINRPLGAVWQGPKGQGRVAVLGSVTIFEDAWLDKEDNSKLLDFLLLWLTHQTSLEVDKLSAEELEANDLQHVPSTEALAGRLRCCLQEAEELPKDFTKLLDDKLFKYDTNLIHEVAELYKKLGVKHEPLTLIAPKLEVPFPKCQPAVFPPIWREPAPPDLDLFDLDECFASPADRLGQLTNKCKSAEVEDMNFYITEAASILGVTPKAAGVGDGNLREAAKAYLSFIFQEIVNMKKSRSGSEHCTQSNHGD
ncbi:unnamed protein product [Calypogeia fissa]